MNQIDASPGRESQIITLQRRPSTGTLHDDNGARAQFKQQPQLVAPPSNEPLYYDFFDRSPAIRTARKAYLVNMCKGVFLVSIWIFAVLSIYWGSLWKVPDGKVTGFIVVRHSHQLCALQPLKESRTSTAALLVHSSRNGFCQNPSHLFTGRRFLQRSIRAEFHKSWAPW